ncbi:MAG TPA: hypothetical protein VFN71_07460, partial [Methylomirabilota bacterium]|nr:hypothetical protein [Methylomirabilota bacterium]
QQVAAVLADVSSSLFSVDGEPGRVLADNPVPALEGDDDLDAVLGEPEPECAGALCGVEGFTEATEDTGG